MDKKTVEYVANLARLKLSDEELLSLETDLSQILKYADQLSKLNTDDVEPLAHPGDIQNAMRNDELVSSFQRESIQQNSPKSDGEFYLVPAVLGGANDRKK